MRCAVLSRGRRPNVASACVHGNETELPGIVMGLLLAIAEVAARRQRPFECVGLLDCLVVGIAQVGALIPGVSRSGSTLTASRTCTLGSAKRRFNSA